MSAEVNSGLAIKNSCVLILLFSETDEIVSPFFTTYVSFSFSPNNIYWDNVFSSVYIVSFTGICVSFIVISSSIYILSN